MSSGLGRRPGTQGQYNQRTPFKTILRIFNNTGAYNGARGTIVARMLKSGTEDTITLLP